MMKILKIFTFLLFFQLEVRVKAHTDTKLSEATAIASLKSAKTWKSADHEFNLASESLIIKESDTEIRFCEGLLRVSSEHALTVKFLHGQIHSQRGSYLISTKQKNNRRVWIANEGSDLEIKLRDGRKMNIPAGFAVWVEGLDTHAKQVYGVIQPWNYRDHIEDLNRLDLGSKAKFFELAAVLKDISRHAQAEGPGLYQKIIDRRIASLEDEAQKRRDRANEEYREKEARRRLFFQRTFNR